MSQVVTYPQPDVAIPGRAWLGEGPVFDPRTGRLCWVNVDHGELFENDLRSGQQCRWSVNTKLGAVAPRESEPGFAVAVSEGLGLLVDGTLHVVEPVLLEPYRRMNDAKCDSRGRLWAGSLHTEFTPGVGALHRWDGNTPSVVAATGFSLPNGLGWNLEDTVMYLADSITRQLLSAPYSPEAGDVGDFSELCTLESGAPDGLAVDVDGCVWVAVWGGSEVHRYDAHGRLVGRIPMPVEKPSSCAFGDDGTLYITSATANIDEVRLRRQPLAGSVFAVGTDTHGVPVRPFLA